MMTFLLIAIFIAGSFFGIMSVKPKPDDYQCSTLFDGTVVIERHRNDAICISAGGVPVDLPTGHDCRFPPSIVN